jgi:hypothetical protein
MSDNPEDLKIIPYLESLGAPHVRLKLSVRGFPAPRESVVIKWLAKMEEEERARSDASQIEQNQTALSAKKAAWIAAIAATAAAIVAIIGAVIACLAWLRPHMS